MRPTKSDFYGQFDVHILMYENIINFNKSQLFIY
jgi:hypothetical protein